MATTEAIVRNQVPVPPITTETFSENDIVSATQRQLTWTHLKSLMYPQLDEDDMQMPMATEQ